MQTATKVSFNKSTDYHITDYSYRGRVSEVFGVQVPKLNAGYVLDVGCNRGHTTYDLSNIYPNCKILGIDIDEKFVSAARRRYQGGNIAFTVMDGHSNPLPDNSFAAVYAMHNVFYKVESGRIGALRGLKEMGRLAEPGGHLLICGDSKGTDNFGIFKKLMRGSSFRPVSIWCHPEVDPIMGRIVRALQ